MMRYLLHHDAGLHRPGAGRRRSAPEERKRAVSGPGSATFSTERAQTRRARSVNRTTSGAQRGISPEKHKTPRTDLRGVCVLRWPLPSGVGALTVVCALLATGAALAATLAHDVSSVVWRCARAGGHKRRLCHEPPN